MEDNKYQSGKIYKVIDNDYNMCYIGSTIQTLSNRLSDHKRKYLLFKNNEHHNVSIFKIFDEYGIDNCKIELIELYPCATRIELTQKEGEHIKNNPGCVNRCIAGRSQKDYASDNKDKLKSYRQEYYKTNKEDILNKQKEYHIQNREKRLDAMKQWKEDNKDVMVQWKKDNPEKVKEHNRKYREAHKENINKRCMCEVCGISILSRNRTAHENTKRHIEKMSSPMDI